MKLKEKIRSWKNAFSYRQKVIFITLSGVIVGLCLLFAYLLRMHSKEPAK